MIDSGFLTDKKTVGDKLKPSLGETGGKNRKPWLRVGAVVLAFLLLGSVCCSAVVFANDDDSGAISEESIVYVKVEPGMTADMVADMLQEEGIIRYKFYFWLLAKFYGADSKLKVGYYKLQKDMDAGDVLQILLSGKTSLQVITIPEGFTVNEIAKRLEQEGIVSASDFQAAARKYNMPYAYMQKSDGRIIYPVEGFLFPDTYELEPETEADGLIAMMLGNFDERLSAEIRSRAAECNLSLFELVTMASLVEKEAMYEEDRPIIAQVLLKRWEISMPLQSDASLQYLMDAPKEDVSLADTRIDSPYNTYQNYGLPPGPVANPGLASIKAVLYPANTDYLYFVADRQGHNHYAKTYEEHLALVEQVR